MIFDGSVEIVDGNGGASMRIRRLVTTTAAAALVLGIAAPPATAAPTFTISASPTSLHPGEKTTVSGSTSDPACAEDGVAVRLSFTRPNGSTGSVTVNTTTDTNGAFTADVTVPDNATADEPASVQAVIADCTGGQTTETRSSNVVKLTIEAYDGTFTTNKTQGRPGTHVHVSGTNCWGGDVSVVFTDGEQAEEVDVTLEADKTFSGDYVIPDAPGGDYAFFAQCPGTDYAPRAFLLVNPTPSPTPLPPRPVPGPAHFTG